MNEQEMRLAAERLVERSRAATVGVNESERGRYYHNLQTASFELPVQAKEAR